MTIVAHEVAALRFTAVCALCSTDAEDDFASVLELMSALRKLGWGFIGDPVASRSKTKAVCPSCIKALRGFE